MIAFINSKYLKCTFDEIMNNSQFHYQDSGLQTKLSKCLYFEDYFIHFGLDGRAIFCPSLERKKMKGNRQYIWAAHKKKEISSSLYFSINAVELIYR